MDAAIAIGRGRSHIRPDGHDRNHARGLRVDRAEARPDGKGGYLITLPHGVIDRLGAMRGRGESYRAGPAII
jgi:hypothetical protein